MTTPLGVLLQGLDAEDLDALAEMLAPRLAARTPAPASDGWMTTAEAAAYLGMTANALHKLTARRAIPFEQDGRRGRCYFRRADLDQWRSR